MPILEIYLSAAILSILAILAGILIIIWPRILAFAIGIWLIIYGVLNLPFF